MPSLTENYRFTPISTFNWKINRAERSHQVRFLAPLLEQPKGLIWFLEQLDCQVSNEDVPNAEIFHLCFPLRDIFTVDYKNCRGVPHLEDQFIAYYNRLFGLPEYFGVNEVWKTAPGGTIRHPAAGGRAGLYEAFLQERISNIEHYELARNMRRMLGTEADLLILTEEWVILVELKYLSSPSIDQFKRH